MKKYLIIGGAGFIGSHLLEALLESCHKVAVIDDFSTGVIKKIDKRVKIYKTNIDDFNIVKKIFKKEKPDFVYHLAGAINLRRRMIDPLFSTALNILGRTKVILDACKSNKVKKIIFISSGGAIYENAGEVPTKEDYPAHPTSLYGLANLITEKYIEIYSKEYSVNYVILRFSNVYGPRQWESGIIPSLIINLLNNKRPIIYGDGKQTRDFIYIKDVIDALITAAEKNVKGIYNVGSGQETSLNEIFRLVKNALEIESAKPTYVKLREQETKRSALDIGKIRKKTKWKPKIHFKEGIVKTIGWFKSEN